LRIFYTMLTVTLFVPVLAGLYAPHASTLEAGTSIGCGIAATVVTQFATGGKGVAGLTPDVLGVAAALIAFTIVYVSRMTFYGATRTL
jgi:SSS family solute:Na+ symporter